MSNYYEKTNDGQLYWRESEENAYAYYGQSDWRESEENVYYRFIVNNFGNIHLKGCKFLAEACQMYEAGEHQAMLIYERIAAKYGTTLKGVERCIRLYVDKMDRSTIEELLPSVNYTASKAIMAGIVYVVSVGGHHENNKGSV